MKKEQIIFILLIGATLFSCHSKRDPGRIYMPDMAYSRAYEAYAQINLQQDQFYYNPAPVEGTIRRGDLFPYTLPNDSNGYKMSAAIKNPLPLLDTTQMLEAQRLYNINCAVCHGANLDAQGPLAGKVGGIANLTLPQYIDEPEGQMYHVVVHGKGNMGSYASQLSRKQRWMVIQYIKAEQMKLKTGGGNAGDSTKSGTSGGEVHGNTNATAKK